MSRVDDYLIAALKALPSKPDDRAKQSEKKAYSEAMSAGVALALATELRARGMTEARPARPGEPGLSGAERRLAGGIGAKKVDVTWATEESGLLLGISVKTINFCDGRTGNYQKNLTNRRGDMLAEALTLHRRFPYAVVAGFLFLDMGARFDQTAKRKSTFDNAFPRLRLFTGRHDPAGRDEQYERLYLVLVDAGQARPVFECYHVCEPETAVLLSDVMDDLVGLVAERNFDFYEAADGRVARV
ncbi:MAG TPA: hypothetical protein PLB30_06855 [Thermoleophilia bacterium]|nr:hypothetical protein [Anaerolineae bacterium]HQG04104.1 hypothetical protein [Thermoleophilia bacterium]HQJ98248.1 hypothetical protein [Thermoleophilia bacterium]